jgi:hypothetical protein
MRASNIIDREYMLGELIGAGGMAHVLGVPFGALIRHVGPPPLCGSATIASPISHGRRAGPTDIGARVFPARQHPAQQLDGSIGTKCTR